MQNASLERQLADMAQRHEEIVAQMQALQEEKASLEQQLEEMAQRHEKIVAQMQAL